MAKKEIKKEEVTEIAEETISKRKKKEEAVLAKEILFSKDNYMIMGLGLLIVIIGFFLMAGGNNGPDEWKADEIYSFTRITLSPILILSGLIVVVVAIFKKS